MVVLMFLFYGEKMAKSFLRCWLLNLNDQMQYFRGLIRYNSPSCKNVIAHLLGKTGKQDHITRLLRHWLPVMRPIQCVLLPLIIIIIIIIMRLFINKHFKAGHAFIFSLIADRNFDHSQELLAWKRLLEEMAQIIFSYPSFNTVFSSKHHERKCF